MFDSLIEYSLKSRGFVILVLLGLVGSGIYSLLSLPIDAVPDITNVQVMALTSAPALGPQEVEQFITIPVENAMNGIPRIKEVRSFSQFGISGVTIIFEDGTDIYWARQQVGERLDQVRASIPRSSASPRWGRSRPAWARSISSRSATPRTARTPAHSWSCGRSSTGRSRDA